MDPHRGSYADEPERWFGGEHPDRPQYQDQDWDYRVPDPRAADRFGAPQRYPVGPRSGEPLPPPDPLAREHAGEPRSRSESIDVSGLRRPGGPAPAGDNVYRARRPAIAALVGLGAVIFAVPALRILLRSAFGPTMSVSGTVSSSLLLVALPLAAIGLYGLATGAARVPDAPVNSAWLRPPLAYLVVGLVLLLGAGLAAH